MKNFIYSNTLLKKYMEVAKVDSKKQLIEIVEVPRKLTIVVEGIKREKMSVVQWNNEDVRRLKGAR